MKKRKDKKPRLMFIVALFAVMMLGALAFIRISYKKEVIFQPVKRKTATVYPAQYSDSHITANAVIADPKFRNLTFFDRNIMLASTISAVTKNTPENSSTSSEKGTWLWTPISDITPKYRDSVLIGAKKNGLRNIYLSIDSYLDIFIMPEGPEKQAKQEAFDAIVENFIVTANGSGLTVDAEAGWKNWAEPGNTYKAFAILDYVIRFNASHKNKFRGFQYDVEPYLLDSYKKDKATALSNYLDLINGSVSALAGSDLTLSVVIPEFYDGTSGETPVFSYRGKQAYAFEHLLSILERRAGSKIIIMSYRNFTKGEDSSLDVSKDEIAAANNTDTKVIVAQETGDVEPPYITFFNTSKQYLNKQLRTIESAFSGENSFGGIAIHYINAYMDLK